MENYDETTPSHILRGLYATPIICELSKLGVFSKASKKINLKNKKKIKNKLVLDLCLDYLLNIGLLEKKKDGFELTNVGYEIFRRSNSFFVPHSYREVILNLGNILTDKKKLNSCKVDRNENILGSGLTHLRYFFQPINYSNSNINYDSLIDLGCGNGHFINEVLKRKKNLKIVGIDLSKDSVQTCRKNIKKHVNQNNFKIFKFDISKVKLWNKKISKFLKNRKPLISLWFMLHEISDHKVKNLKKFLSNLYDAFPKSFIIIGEIVRLENRILKEIYNKSLMPEYLFFHKISGQGIMSWKEYKSLLIDSPYTLEYKWLFDNANSSKIPSAFVWVLRPKKKYARKKSR